MIGRNRSARTFTRLIRALRRAERVLGRIRAAHRTPAEVPFGTAPVPMWLFDVASLRICDANEAAWTLYGYTREEFIGKSLRDLRPASQLPMLEGVIASLRQGKDVCDNQIWWHKTKSGEDLWVRISGTWVQQQGRRFRFVIVTDVTVQVRAEAALRQLNSELERRVAERVFLAAEHSARATNENERRARLDADLSRLGRNESLAALTMAITHEMKQPLAAVTNYCAGIERRLAASTDPAHIDLASAARLASQSALRACELIQRLRDLGLGRPPEFRPEDLNECIDTALFVCGPAIRESGTVLCRSHSSGVPRVEIDGSLVTQVIVNLVRNAIEAITDWSGYKSLTVTTALLPHERVQICITDSGPGFAPGFSADGAQAFHSTKGSGRGLGLLVCRLIVDQHGGQLSSSHTCGAQVTVELPIRQHGRTL